MVPVSFTVGRRMHRPSASLLLPSCLLALCAAGHARAADTAQDPFTFKLGGRLHWDIARFDNDARGAENRNGDDLRAAWLDVSGRIYSIDYKLEADFSGDEVLAKDVYLAYRSRAGTFTLGQFKQHVTLDDRVSSNHTMFVERSLLGQALAPTYRLGAGWLKPGKGYTLAASLYSLESIDVWQTKGRAAAARGTWNPQLAPDGLTTHVGLSVAREDYDHPGAQGASALRIRARPVGVFGTASQSTLADFSRGLDTRVEKASLELAAVRGPLTVQGEWGGATLQDAQQRARIAAGYVQAAWVWGAAPRPYDTKAGRFGRLQPASRYGAWELALRYDRIGSRQHAFGTAPLRDVEVQAWTAGVNWYPRPHLRVMLDWIDGRTRDRLRDTTADRTRALAARLQLDF